MGLEDVERLLRGKGTGQSPPLTLTDDFTEEREELNRSLSKELENVPSSEKQGTVMSLLGGFGDWLTGDDDPFKFADQAQGKRNSGNPVLFPNSYDEPGRSLLQTERDYPGHDLSEPIVNRSVLLAGGRDSPTVFESSSEAFGGGIAHSGGGWVGEQPNDVYNEFGSHLVKRSRILWEESQAKIGTPLTKGEAARAAIYETGDDGIPKNMFSMNYHNMNMDIIPWDDKHKGIIHTFSDQPWMREFLAVTSVSKNGIPIDGGINLQNLSFQMDTLLPRIALRELLKKTALAPEEESFFYTLFGERGDENINPDDQLAYRMTSNRVRNPETGEYGVYVRISMQDRTVDKSWMTRFRLGVGDLSAISDLQEEYDISEMLEFGPVFLPEETLEAAFWGAPLTTENELMRDTQARLRDQQSAHEMGIAYEDDGTAWTEYSQNLELFYLKMKSWANVADSPDE